MCWVRYVNWLALWSVDILFVFHLFLLYNKCQKYKLHTCFFVNLGVFGAFLSCSGQGQVWTGPDHCSSVRPEAFELSASAGYPIWHHRLGERLPKETESTAQPKLQHPHGPTGTDQGQKNINWQYSSQKSSIKQNNTYTCKCCAFVLYMVFFVGQHFL